MLESKVKFQMMEDITNSTITMLMQIKITDNIKVLQTPQQINKAGGIQDINQVVKEEIMEVKQLTQIILILPNLQILIRMNLNQLIDIIIIKLYQKVKKIIKDKQEDLMLNSNNNNNNNITINIKNLKIMAIISLSEKHQMLIQIQISEIHKVKEYQEIIHLITMLKMSVKLLDNHKLH